MRRYDWERIEASKGPADWDWVQALGALLLSIGLVGVGLIAGLNFHM